ncbi:hypothetical protein DID80_07995 [Candidatus Marinamargulisbacteria bacterium SCGC AAA071-K20]|nr:hypothetical protein DID80_07995 [Candidatus Marinamargulisbacteria bacterium SCGC AAA071-K20]
MISSGIFKEVCSAIFMPLQDAGFEAFIVGGATRNAILGREISDIDITTNAKPEDIEAIFENTVPTGKQFGTITVIIKKDQVKSYEVTTYRSEAGYSDSRHPSEIVYETDIKKDLERRDFTINALAYNPLTKQFIDNHEGLQDLSEGVIRCIGAPKERFTEDTLRIFRAFRFSAQLEFYLDFDTKEAIKEIASTFTIPAIERVQLELDKLIMSERPSCALTMLRNFGVLKRLSSEFPKVTGKEINNCDSTEKHLRWPMLLQQCDYKAFCKTLRFGRKRSRYIQLLIEANLDERKAFATVKELEISSQDLMSLGYAGVNLGKIQRELLAHILDNPEDNTSEKLMAIAKEELKHEN